jgi:hypothetical protein
MGICRTPLLDPPEDKACLPKVVAVNVGLYPDRETCIPPYESGLFKAPDCLSGNHFSGIMYKNPLFLYTVFHKPSNCIDFRRSGRFPWRWLYNNGQFPEAEVRAGWGTGGSNAWKGCFGSDGSYSSLGYIVGFSGDGSGGERGPGASEISG